MTSHQVAKILLENPDAPVIVQKPAPHPFDYSWVEITSITFTNCGLFVDSNLSLGDDYNSRRECVEIK